MTVPRITSYNVCYTKLLRYFNYRHETSVLVDVGIWLSLALTIVSGLDYVFRVRRVVNEPPT